LVVCTQDMKKRLVASSTLISGTTTLLLAGLLFSSCNILQKSGVETDAKLPFGGVNEPTSGQKVAGKLNLAGWTISDSEMESVSVYVDRSFATACILGVSRPDVGQAYPAFNSSDQAGWRAELDTSGISPGWHELTIQARSKDGATRDLASPPVLVER